MMAIAHLTPVGRRRVFPAFAVTAALVLAGCSDSDGPVEPVKKDAVKATVEDIGECLRFDETIGKTIKDLPFIACTEDHTHEVYAVNVYDEDKVYPGFDELEDEARVYCLEQFDEYVGRSAFDSVLFYSWLVPTLDGWNDKDIKDRSTLCVLGEPGTTLSESMRDKNR